MYLEKLLLSTEMALPVTSIHREYLQCIVNIFKREVNDTRVMFL